MYRVTIYNGDTATIIHEVSTDPSEPHLYSCTLTEGSSGTIDSLEFTILPNNPGYELLNSRYTMITVLNTRTDTAEFQGRILTITPQMDNSGMVYKTVVCESRLGFLCDSVQPYTEEATYALEDFFTLLLENHNAQVEDYKKIYPGNVSATASASTGNVTKALNYETTWDALKSKLLDTEGGEIQLYTGTDGLMYLDYVDELGSIKDQTIELAKNMKSISQEIDPTSVITRLIPLGAKLEDEDGNDTEERLTIADVNGGSIYIDDEDAQEVYGIVEGTVEWDDVTVADNLLTKAQAWLDAQTIVSSITLDALDLWLLGLEEDSLERYNYYRIINSAIGLDAYFRVIKRTVDICDPSNITYEMGSQDKTVSSTIARTSSSAQKAVDDAAAVSATLSKTVASLIAANAEIAVLTATIATIQEAYISNLEVETLLADYIKTDELEADVATFGYVKTTELEAEVASIGFLTADTIVANGITVKSLIADVANINTVLAGSIGTGTLQSIHITSDNVVIDEAVITSAMIVDLAASKLTAGTIYTDYIKIANNEGQNLWIDGSTIQINDGTYVRVQIGEDASGDYNLYLWDSSGTLLWDAKGLTESGLIGNGAIIKDAAVADDAAISGSKLDIASVASRLNEDGSLTVDYSMVTIDDTTLSAWYTSVNTNITELGSTTSTLQTNLTVVQGQIEAKVWQTDIDTAVNDLGEEVTTLSDKYADIVATIDGVTSTVGDLQTTVGDNYEELTNQISVISQTATDIKSELSTTYATITYADEAAGSAESAAEGYTDNLLASYYTMSQINSITQTLNDEINQIKLDVADTYFTQSDAVTLQSTLESSITTNTTNITAEVTRATSAESTLSAADTKYGTCSTAAGTAAKVVSCSSFTTLSAGALICVYFTYANTATSPTLNVNSTGAKTIYAYGAAIASGSDYNWTAKSYVNFMYDGTHWVLIDAGASSKITMLADSISLEVTSGTGGTASIVLSVDGETSDSMEYVTSARKAFEAEDSSITISAGTITFASDTLRVYSTDLTLDENGASFAGTLESPNGLIAGWIIGENAIYNGTASMYDETEGIYVGIDGIRSCSSDSNYINITGGMISGIGGSTIFDTLGEDYHPHISMYGGEILLYADEYDLATSPIGAVELNPTGIDLYCAEDTAWCSISNLNKEIAVGDYIRLDDSGDVTTKAIHCRGGLNLSALTTPTSEECVYFGTAGIRLRTSGNESDGYTLSFVGGSTNIIMTLFNGSGYCKINNRLIVGGDTYIGSTQGHYIVSVTTCTLTSSTSVADGSTWSASGTCTAPSTYTGTITIPRYGNYGYPSSGLSISVSGTTATVSCNYRNASGGSHTLSAQCIVIFYI